MHEDKGFVGFTKIKKADWERIFGKREDVRVNDPRAATPVKRGRVRRDSDDFMNRPTPWV